MSISPDCSAVKRCLCRQRHPLDLVAVAEHRGGDGAADVDVQPAPVALAVGRRETGQTGVDTADDVGEQRACLPRSTMRPAVEHQDLVGVDDRRQPVRDHQRGAIQRRCDSSCVLDRLLGFESSAEVASSKTRIGGFFSSARAIATRCFSPPESFRPRSPTTRLVAVRAATVDEVVECAARGGLDLGLRGCRGGRRRCCRTIVSLNSTVSCGTMPIACAGWPASPRAGPGRRCDAAARTS
jgi:hypothetical protein